MFSPWERELPEHGTRGKASPTLASWTYDPDLLRAKEFARRIMERECQMENCERKVHVGFHYQWHGDKSLQDHVEKERKPGNEHSGEEKDTLNKGDPEYKRRINELIKILLTKHVPASQGTP